MVTIACASCSDGRAEAFAGSGGGRPCPAEDRIEFSSPPVVKNPRQLRRRIEKEYQRIADGDSIRGTVHVRLLLDQQGLVQQLRLQHGTGTVLDSLALRVMRQTEFHPAYLDRSPVCFWLQFPMRFPPGTDTQ